jgi:anti-anti-sigma factor
LRGDHDLSTVDALCAALAQAVMTCDADVVVDASDVEFMGVATVEVLTRARDVLRSRSRTLVVRSPSTCVRRVIVLCDRSDLLDAHPVIALPPLAEALSTWVAVPATDPSEHHAQVPVPIPAVVPLGGLVTGMTAPTSAA